MKFSNINEALVWLSSEFMSETPEVSVSYNDRTKSETREMLFPKFTFLNPMDRIISVPGRGDNIVAKIAETLWVIGGSNEIKYILPFLPRAADFSDDGVTWRAGYGPRMRGDRLGDPIKYVIESITKDKTTRQASLAILNNRDDHFKVTKDYPCTQVLNFIVRNNKLDLMVTMRSNDFVWGFTGINHFEFTFLQELIANILEVEVGQYHHSVVSFHVYERHYQTLEKILEAKTSQVRSVFDPLKHVPILYKSIEDFDSDFSYYEMVLDDFTPENKFFAELVQKCIDEKRFKSPYFYIPLLKLAEKQNQLAKIISEDTYLYEALINSKFF